MKQIVVTGWANLRHLPGKGPSVVVYPSREAADAQAVNDACPNQAPVPVEVVAFPSAEDEAAAAFAQQVNRMVDRFLMWKLPADFRPDAGISFKPDFNEHTPHPMRHEPRGTNLLDAMQARAMVLHMLEGLTTLNPPKASP